MGRNFSLKLFKTSGVLLFAIGNLLLFQNCSQPFEVLDSNSTLDATSLGEQSFTPPRVGDYYAYGDMLVHAEDVKNANEERVKDPTMLQSINVGASGDTMWPGRVIPISITTDEPNYFNAEQLEAFKQSLFKTCETWAQEVNITCVPYTNHQYRLNGLLTRNIEKYCTAGAGACASLPTANKVRNFYAYNPTGDLNGTMLHEFGHTLGLMHEHQHDNADQFYDYPSTDPTQVNFGYYVLPFKYSKHHAKFGFVPTFNSEYDPQSVMHYRSLEKYGIKPKLEYQYLPTFSKHGAAQPTSGISYAHGRALLTVNDTLGAQKLYGTKSGSKKTCRHPETGEPYFFDNTLKGFFEKKFVSTYGEKCKIENRYCIGGILSGNYTESSCLEVCEIGDGTQLKKGESKTVYIKNIDPFIQPTNQWEKFEATCNKAGHILLTDHLGKTRHTQQLDVIHSSIPKQPETILSYSWHSISSGICSASPSYSYGAWSTCGSNSTQTRTSQCINTSGTQARLVTCKDSNGKLVADSKCVAKDKPVTSVTCTAVCKGTPVTSQTCTYKPPVTYAWNVTASGSCSASPSYSYGSWSTCASNSTQTRSAQCVNTSGSQLRLVTCRDSTGKFVADSYCAGQTKPTTSVSCTASCTGSPVTSQACVYETYSWKTMTPSACSAKPSYSYGTWSACASNAIQTRGATCVNTTGTINRIVACISSKGSYVEESKCVAKDKPAATLSCTAGCTGSPVTSQSCTPPISTRACIIKNRNAYQTITSSSTGQEYSPTNTLKITDGKVILHTTRNSSSSGNMVAIHKNGHYSLVALKTVTGTATLPSSVMFEGNSKDYQITRGSTDNMITISHKSCGEVMRYTPQGSGSMSMFIAFKDCSAIVNHTWSQQGTNWQFVGGDKLPLNSVKAITGCTPYSSTSSSRDMHIKNFGW